MDYNSQFKINKLEDEREFYKKMAEKLAKENKLLKKEKNELTNSINDLTKKIDVYKSNISQSNITVLRNLSKTISSTPERIK